MVKYNSKLIEEYLVNYLTDLRDVRMTKKYMNKCMFVTTEKKVILVVNYVVPGFELQIHWFSNQSTVLQTK